MKKTQPPDGQIKFSGSLRHYHRTGPQTQPTWDDWVEGGAAKPRGSRNWLKITGIVVGVLVLLGIISGLIIELS